MSRPRIPSRLAVWQLGCRGLSFVTDAVFLSIFLWSSIRGRYFSIPAYIGLLFAFLIDVEEIIALTNTKRNIRRWWTMWILFVDVLAAGLLWSGLWSFTKWPTSTTIDHDRPPEDEGLQDSSFALGMACITGFAIHVLLIFFYATVWIVSMVRRRRKNHSIKLMKVESLDQLPLHEN